jgi:hypothetical protein
MGAILNWIYSLPISYAVRTSSGLQLVIRFAHMLSIMFVLFSISKVDFRLMGISEKRKAVTEVIGEFLPWTFWSFIAAVTTGALLFMSKAPSFYSSGPFRLKILVIGLAGINVGVFHAFTYRSVALWDDGVSTAFAAKVAGALSLAFWIAAAALGVQVFFTAGR